MRERGRKKRGEGWNKRKKIRGTAMEGGRTERGDEEHGRKKRGEGRKKRKKQGIQYRSGKEIKRAKDGRQEKRNWVKGPHELVPRRRI